MLSFLALVITRAESAQSVYDRLQARLAHVAWVEFTEYSLAETNIWNEYRVERPGSVSFAHHTAFSIYTTDGKRTTYSEGVNRPARSGDARTPPGWECLVGRRAVPKGVARENEGGTAIDLSVGKEAYELLIDGKTGLPCGYRIVSTGSDPRDSLDFRYGKVQLHAEAPVHPIRVAAPKPLGAIVGPFRAWLQRSSTTQNRERVDLRELGALPKGQAVGIRWFDATQEAYVVRAYSRNGWTDVYYSTEAKGGIHFPVGYERFVEGKRTEKVGIEVAVP